MKPVLISLGLILYLLNLASIQANSMGNWQQLSIKNSCIGMNPHICLNAYGFRIDRSGHYMVGPNNSGKILTGTLNPNEFSQLENSARLVANAFLIGNVNCRTVPGLPDIQTLIKIKLEDGTNHVIRGINGIYATSCSGENPGAFIKLNSELNKLSLKYYPASF